MNVIVLPRARTDIRSAYQYLYRESPEAALRFIAELREAFLTLSKQPKIGRARIQDSPRLSGLRSWLVRRFNYLIFYRLTGENIEVVRILHSARDIDSILEPE